MTFKLIVPWQPLHDYLDPGGVCSLRELARRLDLDPNSVRRWVAKGHLTMAKADVIAVGLGHHPAEIWGNDWFAHT